MGEARARRPGRDDRDRGPPGVRDDRLPRTAGGRRRAVAGTARAAHAWCHQPHRAHDRRGLADRVGAADRRAGAHRARRRPRRGPRAGRARRGAGAVAGVGRPGQPGRLADGHRQAPRDRRAAPRQRRSSASTQELGARARGSRRRRPRRAALEVDDVGDDLLRLVFTCLPPGALHRGADRAHAAAARRPHHAGDRARLPRPGGDGRAAHRAAPSARSPKRTSRSRCPAATSSRARLASVLEVIYLDLQRGLLGDRRRRLDAPGPVRRGAAARAACSPSWRRASPRSTASSR